MVRQHVIDEEKGHALEVNTQFKGSDLPASLKEAMEMVERFANNPVKMEALRNEFKTLEKEIEELEAKKGELESRMEKVKDVLDNSHEVEKALTVVKEAILEGK